MSTEVEDIVYEDKEQIRKNIQEDIDAFLARGGEITECEPFETSDALDKMYIESNHWMFERD